MGDRQSRPLTPLPTAAPSLTPSPPCRLELGPLTPDVNPISALALTFLRRPHIDFSLSFTETAGPSGQADLLNVGLGQVHSWPAWMRPSRPRSRLTNHPPQRGARIHPAERPRPQQRPAAGGARGAGSCPGLPRVAARPPPPRGRRRGLGRGRGPPGGASCRRPVLHAPQGGRLPCLEMLPTTLFHPNPNPHPDRWPT